jgi:hypothetical protein
MMMVVKITFLKWWFLETRMNYFDFWYSMEWQVCFLTIRKYCVPYAIYKKKGSCFAWCTNQFRNFILSEKLCYC